MVFGQIEKLGWKLSPFRPTTETRTELHVLDAYVPSTVPVMTGSRVKDLSDDNNGVHESIAIMESNIFTNKMPT